MPLSPIHEVFLCRVVKEIEKQLDAIRSGQDEAALSAQSVSQWRFNDYRPLSQ